MISNWPLLSIIIFLPLTGVLFLLCMSNNNKDLDINIFHRNVKFVTLWTTFITFLGSIIILLNFDNSFSGYQFEEEFKWIKKLNIYYYIGVDGLSLPLILLTTFLFPICILFSWKNIKNKIREYMILFLLLETLIIGMFSSLDLILFYVFAESIFIPIFLIVGIWGGNSRLKALYKMFIFSFITSLLFLYAITYIYTNFGTTNLRLLLNIDLIPEIQIWLFLAFMAVFAIKIPLWPFHSWVSEINSECPSAFSIILICIILKISGYGLLRFSLPLFPNASLFLQDYIFYLSFITISYSLILCFFETNFQKLIAYYSFSHMGLIIIGIFSFNKQGLDGAMFQMISDGLIFAGLLLSVGILNQVFKSQEIIFFGDLINIIPKFGLFFNFFIISSIGFPGTSSFVGDILIFLGSWKSNPIIMVISLFSLIIGSFFVISLHRHIMYGSPKNYGSDISDISIKEALTFIPLVFLIILLGFSPNLLLEFFDNNSNFLINIMENLN
tara:strand:- start:159 stop:1655 length:1497 start_codon:yes stop_codon:yes gene_type:complete